MKPSPAESDDVGRFYFRHIRRLLSFVGLILAFIGRAEADEPKTPAHRLIVGWDDAVIVCGPGTVAGMDSPQAIEQMVKRWKGRGHQGIYWRVDEAMLPDRFMTRWKPKVSPRVNYLLERVDQKLHEFPVLKTLLAAAEREQLEVWAWYPTIYSNGAPPTGPGFTQAWLYENKFGTDHSEVLSVDRAGNKHFMVWEYAYPEARKAKVSEFVQFARDYGFKRFVACLRTEAAQMQPAPKHADQFGFNAPVVAEMKKRHGIDILTDARFDYSHPKFDLRDPLVEAWRKLRGDYLTQFYRELRAALNEVDPTIQIAVQIPGDRAGTCLGNWHLDWRTWIDEGLVNELVVPVVLDGYEGYGPRAKLADFGYIDGAVSVETVRQFVKQSRHPTTRVIQAGGPASNFHTPPPHATAQVICRDVPYAAQFNAFNMIEFSPQGATGSVFYLDDVSLRWTPTPNFEALGKEMLLQANFESAARDRWTLREGQASDITIDNDVSYGHELQSLRMRGSGGRVELAAPSLTWQPDGLLLVDADIFLRSNLPYVQITPGPNVTSSDEVGLSLVTTGDNQALIELRTHHATWHHREGDKLIDTKVSAAFDAWNHLQLVIDPPNKSYRVLLQVIGEAPRLLCRGSLNRTPAASDPLAVEFFFSRSQTNTDGPAFDNLRVTRRILRGKP